MDNMKLWTQVCQTDPAITKSITKGKGFKLTAIDAQSQVKRATELFGPYGIGWGIDTPSYTPHGDSLLYEAVLWYRFNGERGQFPIASDIKWVDGQDCVKKVRTDALTKGLSMLGFNSDVFEGKFDDNKYVESLKKSHEEERKETVKKVGQVPDPNPEQAKVLGILCSEYTDMCDEGYYADYRELCKVVWQTWGKYPNKESSLAGIRKKIDPKESIIKKNDFTEGL